MILFYYYDYYLGRGGGGGGGGGQAHHFGAFMHKHASIIYSRPFAPSAMEALSNSDSVYFAEVERFSKWCGDNSLDLNVKKTKEMLIDFRKVPAVIHMKVERVTEYKYPGRILDNKLNFNKNTDFIHKNKPAKNILPSEAKISYCQCCCFTHFLPELY